MSRRALGSLKHIGVLAVIVGCVVAGFWQLGKYRHSTAFNTELEGRMRAAPQPLAAPAGPGHLEATPLLYRRIEVVGTYDTSHEVVLVGRSFTNSLGDDITGNDVLTPLVTADGRAIFVNRGWVPYSVGNPPVASAAPPSGTVRVVGVLFASERSTVRPAAATQRVTTWIDLPQLARQVPYPIYPVYLWLQAQDPGQPNASPRAVPLPRLDRGPYLSYTIQWFLFATVGLVGYPLLLARSRRRRAVADLPQEAIGGKLDQGKSIQRSVRRHT